jgi:hypothetical protein
MPYSEQRSNQSTADRSRTLDFESEKKNAHKKAQHRISQYGWGFQMVTESPPPMRTEKKK